MTIEITEADFAAAMFAADMSVEDEIERLRSNARAAAVSDLVADHLPAHLPPLRLRCRDDYFGNPRLSGYPSKSGHRKGFQGQAEAFAAWLTDQGVEDYLVQLREGDDPTVFTAHLTLAGLPLTLRLFAWSWETTPQAAEAVVADAVAAARASRVEVAA
jgi:hypothetical protein